MAIIKTLEQIHVLPAQLVVLLAQVEAILNARVVLLDITGMCQQHAHLAQLGAMHVLEGTLISVQRVILVTTFNLLAQQKAV